MKKLTAGIVTLYGNDNFGNKLQNYALQKYLFKYFKEVETFKVDDKKISSLTRFLLLIKLKVKRFIPSYKRYYNRYKNFISFNKKYINYSKIKLKNTNQKIDKVDYVFFGSDQIWNPHFSNNLGIFLGKNFIVPKIGLSASFGINELPSESKKEFQQQLKKFSSISVREDAGVDIIKSLNVEKNVEVLIDPTMLLTDKEWEQVISKPDNMLKGKYILNYFLGDISKQRKEEIERIAKANKCKIINILDADDPFFSSGPSEFLYLEKNAFLICTDSFHSSVFAILFNRPFVIFDRDQEDMKCMNSRINTLLSKFELKNRKFNGKIIKENLEHDYSGAYKILEKERKKADDFISNAIGYSKK